MLARWMVFGILALLALTSVNVARQTDRSLAVQSAPPAEQPSRAKQPPRRQPPRRPPRRGQPQSPVRLPEGITAHRDLAYVEDGHDRQKLDLYVPAKSDTPRPLIIWVHGGGWQNGSKENCLALRAGMLQQGYAVASIGYRLSGDAIFPAQIEDCKAAIRWLRAHAKQYGLNPDRFGVWGSSAGGHLVALIGTSGDVKGLDVGPNKDVSSRVQAVCDYYGPTDFLAFIKTPGYQRHASPNSPESRLLGEQVEKAPEKSARVNPITYVTKDDPPFLIVHGSKDPTVPPNQSGLLHAALQKAGVESTHRVIEGAGHGGPQFSSREVLQQVHEFFDKHLQSAPVDK